MLGDPRDGRAAAGHSFLELWQSGFGGRLTGLLDLTHVAAYALGSICLLIGVTATVSWLRQADERAASRRRDELLLELVPALGRAQRALGRRRLDSPARFAAELSLAAHRLGELLEDVDRAQRSTSDLAHRNAQVSRELRTSAVSLTTAIGRLQATGVAVDSAATALRGVVVRLGDEITGRVSDAAARLETAADSARSELGALQAAGRTTLHEIGERLEEALGAMAKRVFEATDGLVAAGTGFAAEIGASGERAARDIGHIYQEAVAAAAVDLEEKMVSVGERLDTAVRQVDETTRAQAEQARITAATTDEQLRALAETAARDRAEAVARFEALERHLTGLAEMTAAAADRLSETLTATAGRPAVPLPVTAPVPATAAATAAAPNGRLGDGHEQTRPPGAATPRQDDAPGPGTPLPESS
ncbi:hypothetical protein DQ384_25570 [Sphaerisporangium album]|uniref:Uncharacterized protein n=2 Tax=Sphaerisporangium album TaxID=509200 RepID=A0A367FC34_9ACTN|nr:hypothetical protein DQ384_25570 [Sphaerisporangium album]